MRIAILGATSQIAKDLVFSFAAHTQHDLVLYARRPEVVSQWLNSIGLIDQYVVANFEAFSVDEQFDAILNFVGVGNPAQAAAMGASIFDVTLQYDEMALGYVMQHPSCRYLFISSGAAYGSSFDEPANENTKATIAINNLQPQDWYGAAKLYAECRHRSHASLAIVDIRVFNYFSHTQDIAARFLISDTLRSILRGETFTTSAEDIVRDYLGPDELHQIVQGILRSPATNLAIDCYTKEPVRKLLMLDALQSHFGLRYELVNTATGLHATGSKFNYFSLSRRAGLLFGYHPARTALDTVVEQSSILLGTHFAKE